MQRNAENTLVKLLCISSASLCHSASLRQIDLLKLSYSCLKRWGDLEVTQRIGRRHLVADEVERCVRV